MIKRDAEDRAAKDGNFKMSLRMENVMKTEENFTHNADISYANLIKTKQYVFYVVHSLAEVCFGIIPE